MLNKIKKIEIEDLSESGHRVGVEVLEDGTFMLKIGHNEEEEYECAIVDGEVLVAFFQAHLVSYEPDAGWFRQFRSAIHLGAEPEDPRREEDADTHNSKDEEPVACNCGDESLDV